MSALWSLDAFRYAGGQVAQILRGENPAEIPFYQPRKFQLIVNTKEFAIPMMRRQRRTWRTHGRCCQLKKREPDRVRKMGDI
jgi:hypothetical protein